MVDINLKVPAIEKLIDYTASGIGAVCGPMLARWQAQAAADAARIGAQGQADVMRIKAQGQAEATLLIASAQAEARSYFPIKGQSIQGEVNLNKEVKSRLTFQEQKRQGNIGAVVRMAADELGDKQIKDHDVDHDWVARFFADVQDVTSEHMQRIWARILAGEIETPGRTSLHTLSILKNMSQKDARLFEEISRFVFNDFIWNEPKYTSKLPDFPAYQSLVDMESYGLLNSASNLIRTIKIPLEGFNFLMGPKMYKISGKDAKAYELRIPAFPLSPQGRELYSLIEPTISEKYLHSVSGFLNDNHASKLEYAEVLQKLDDCSAKIGPWIVVEPL